MPSVFTLIINGDLGGHFVWKDDVAVSFLSINPLRRGHALVIPRVEVDHWLDLDPDTNAHLMRVAQIVGQGQMQAFQPPRVSMMIAGLDVPHVHLHVVPMHGISDMNFANAAVSADQDDMAAAAAELRQALVAQGHSNADL